MITRLEVVDEDMLLLGLDRGGPVLSPCVWKVLQQVCETGSAK